MRHGFALLEVLLGLVIASLLTGLLFSVVYQTNRALQTVNTLVDGHTKAIFCYQLMARDIAGATIPISVMNQYAHKDQQQKKEQDAHQKMPAQALAPEGAEQQKAEKERKPLTHVFYTDTHDGIVHQLTFITTNSLPVYRSNDTGNSKPRIARVIYRLKPMENSTKDRPSFTLYRQESTLLEYDALKEDTQGSARMYEVVTNIKHMTLKLCVAIKRESKKEAGESQEPTEWRTFSEWNVERNGGNPELAKHSIVLPTVVEITLVVWSDTRTRTEQYTFSVPITAVNTITKDHASQSEKHVIDAPEKISPQGGDTTLKSTDASTQESLIAFVTEPVDATQVIDRIRARNTRSKKTTHTRVQERSKDTA